MKEVISLTVRELIEKLSELNNESEIFISCEGGCVLDTEIRVIQEEKKVILEIE